MTNQGMHDSLVWQALEGLSVPVEKRVRPERVKYLTKVMAMVDAHERGVTVAPRYRQSPAV